MDYDEEPPNYTQRMRPTIPDHHLTSSFTTASASLSLSHLSRAKSEEASLRRALDTSVGAFAVAQAAPGGRRGGPRPRRTAEERRRARQRAGLEPVPLGEESGQQLQPHERYYCNPQEMMVADVKLDDMMIIMEEQQEETLGFWEFDRTDQFICAGIGLLSVALIVILAMALT